MHTRMIDQPTPPSSHYDALLQQYATGCLPEALRLVVACHAQLSCDARSSIRQYEALGGALLETLCGQVPVSPACLEGVMARLETCDTPQLSKPTELKTCQCLPSALTAYTGGSLADMNWKTVLPGVDLVDVPMRTGRADDVRLLRMKPDTAVPEHAHKGLEYTLVLEGAFHDETGAYRRGDLIVHDDKVVHQPRADAAEGCICLTVVTAPIRFTGFWGSVLNLFAR